MAEKPPVMDPSKLFSIDSEGIDVSQMSDEDRNQLFELFSKVEQLKGENAVYGWFPDTGPLRRELYVKHMEFFKLGATKQERLFLAGNRTGKSVTAAVELAFHATGVYPHWWEGHRYDRGIKIYASGKTAKNTRDICQFKLMGEYGQPGTGTIPKKSIVGNPVAKPGVPQAYEIVQVKHLSGSLSTIYFKSYDQGMEAFMGTEIDLAWEDEEPPEDVHSEILVRLMTTSGLLMLTFTPLEGMTEVVTSYLNADLTPDTSRSHIGVVTCGWDEVPHLNAVQKANLLSSTPPHLREARSKGIPSIGSGAVYPIGSIDMIEVDDFALPTYWPRAYALDVGWNKTAALWGALDLESDVLYLYSEHYQGMESPAVHAEGIKARGAWIPGICDFAGTNQDDGTKMMDKYINLGLELVPANKAVEAGIQEVWERMVSGRLKVFKSLKNFWAEFRLYQRDINGKIIKKNDHLMDDLRYLSMSVNEVARTKAVVQFHRNRAESRAPTKRWSM